LVGLFVSETLVVINKPSTALSEFCILEGENHIQPKTTRLSLRFAKKHKSGVRKIATKAQRL
ncbi:hypothetical protein, partial [uncultured Imperialibacter sp.]|uniref:hypothetical protein n=1 Tax=uncultured Imperialibacter sp. TaxID=1672639 RepID=UPI0030D867E8